MSSSTSSSRKPYFKILLAIALGMGASLGLVRLFTNANNASAETILDRVMEARAALPQIIAEKVVPLTQARCERAGRVDFMVRGGDLSVDALPRLRDTLLRHPGRCRVVWVRRRGANTYHG